MKRFTRKTALKWPKAGDDPFLVAGSNSNRSTLANLRWLEHFHTDDSFLAEAFKESADIVVERLKRTKHGRHPDIYFFPVASLYRHSLELQLKDILRLAVRLRMIGKDVIEKVSFSHSLDALWQRTRPVLVAHWPEGPKEPLEGVDAIIRRLHTADSSGQSFRYTKDRKGSSNIKRLPDSVSLTQLRDTCSAISNFFSGCAAQFENLLEVEDETRSHYEP